MSLRWPRSSTSLTFLGLVGLFGTQVAWVAPTNFYGFDEWTLHYLVSRGVTDIPYANRPLELLWELPAPWLSPHSFVPYFALYAAYALLSCWCVFRLCSRLVPGRPALALLAASYVLVWAPRDFARLAYFERTLYTSFVFGTLAACFCFLESWLRRNASLLALGILVAFVTARSYEATIALLLAWPLFIACALQERTRAYWKWSTAWGGFMALALVLILQPMLFPVSAPSYQASLGMELDPSRILARLWREYVDHLVPLATIPWTELRTLGVPVAVVVFVLTCLVGIRDAEFSKGVGWRAIVGWMAAGIALAALGYAVIVLSPVQPGAPKAWRMQFLSAPGVALLLAAIAYGISGALPHALRRPLLVGLGCWVVAVGTARTIAMQRLWDRSSYHDHQVRMLTGLTELAPDLKPHTLVIVLDEGRAWRSTWGFRHAVQYLYRDRAMGYVWDSWDFMFPTRLTWAGVVCVPWPEVQVAWQTAPTLHRVDELVLIRHHTSGEVELLEKWPSVLPPVPPGARYDPRARVLSAAPREERAILTSLEGWGGPRRGSAAGAATAP